MQREVTYRQAVTSCESPRCRRCRTGRGHLYWYAYTTINGHTTRTYVGVKLPADVDPAAIEWIVQPGQTVSVTKRPDWHLTTPESADLRMYALGQIRLERRVEGSWHIVAETAWYREDLRVLFGCLLSAGYTSAARGTSRSLERSTLATALWPHEERAIERLDKIVHELRNVLEPAREKKTSSLLRTDYHSLILADQGQIWCDADAFDLLLGEASRAMPTDLRREELLKEALNLYWGDYFPDVREVEWISARRSVLRRLAISCFLELADRWIQRGDDDGAVNLLRRAIKAEPTNDAVAERLMRLLIQQGRFKEALRVYREVFDTIMQEDEAALLSAELRVLYQSIRQKGEPS